MKILVEISVQFQKILIADIEKFAISAVDILLIRYIGTPVITTQDGVLQLYMGVPYGWQGI